MIKYVISYTKPGHINRKFVIIEGQNLQDLQNKIIKKIGKWVFSRYENYLKYFYPYTGKNNSINIYNHQMYQSNMY